MGARGCILVAGWRPETGIDAAFLAANDVFYLVGETGIDGPTRRCGCGGFRGARLGRIPGDAGAQREHDRSRDADQHPADRTIVVPSHRPRSSADNSPPWRYDGLPRSVPTSARRAGAIRCRLVILFDPPWRLMRVRPAHLRRTSPDDARRRRRV